MVVVVLGSGSPRLPGSCAHVSQQAAWQGKVGSLLIPPEKSGEAGVAASSWKLEGPNRRPRGARRSQPLRTALGGRAEGGEEIGRTVRWPCALRWSRYSCFRSRTRVGVSDSGAFRVEG